MGIEAQPCVSGVRFRLSRRRETVSTHGVGIEAQPCVSGVRFGLSRRRETVSTPNLTPLTQG
jgi:hypothetical protein